MPQLSYLWSRTKKECIGFWWRSQKVALESVWHLLNMQGILYITSNIIKTLYYHCFSPMTSETPMLVFQLDSWRLFPRYSWGVSLLQRLNQKKILIVETVAFSKRMANSPANIFCYNLNLLQKSVQNLLLCPFDLEAEQVICSGGRNKNTWVCSGKNIPEPGFALNGSGCL